MFLACFYGGLAGLEAYWTVVGVPNGPQALCPILTGIFGMSALYWLFRAVQEPAK